VAETAIRRGMDETAFGLGTTSVARAVVLAMMNQPCPAWRTSLFGPSPSVATHWYRCFGRWLGTLSPNARAGAVAAIPTAMLCQGAAGWGNCPPAGRGTAELWEGGPQQVDAITGASPSTLCESIRDRTVYQPMKGRELLKMVQFLGPSANLPPNLADMANLAPGLFLDRDFLLGVQSKKNVDPNLILSSGQDVVGMALSVLEDVALLWAPGQGISVLEFLKGPVDIGRLLALLSQMSPDLVGQLGGIVAAQLPGILAQVGAQMGPILQTAGQILPGLLGGTGMHGLGAFGAAAASAAGQPGTAPVTGIRVIDLRGSQLAGDPAPPLETDQANATTWFIAGAAVALAGLVLWLGSRN
jgi:hypothetical protein